MEDSFKYRNQNVTDYLDRAESERICFARINVLSCLHHDLLFVTFIDFIQLYRVFLDLSLQEYFMHYAIGNLQQ